MFDNEEKEIEFTINSSRFKLSSTPHPRGIGYIPVVYKYSKKNGWVVSARYSKYNQATECLCVTWLKRKFDLIDPEIKERIYSRELSQMGEHITSLAIIHGGQYGW